MPSYFVTRSGTPYGLHARQVERPVVVNQQRPVEVNQQRPVEVNQQRPVSPTWSAYEQIQNENGALQVEVMNHVAHAQETRDHYAVQAQNLEGVIGRLREQVQDATRRAVVAESFKIEPPSERETDLQSQLTHALTQLRTLGSRYSDLLRETAFYRTSGEERTEEVRLITGRVTGMSEYIDNLHATLANEKQHSRSLEEVLKQMQPVNTPSLPIDSSVASSSGSRVTGPGRDVILPVFMQGIARNI